MNESANEALTALFTLVDLLLSSRFPFIDFQLSIADLGFFSALQQFIIHPFNFSLLVSLLLSFTPVEAESHPPVVQCRQITGVVNCHDTNTSDLTSTDTVERRHKTSNFIATGAEEIWLHWAHQRRGRKKTSVTWGVPEWLTHLL